MASRVVLSHRYVPLAWRLICPKARHNEVIGRKKSYWHGASTRPLLYCTKYDVLKQTAEKKGDHLAVVSCHQNLSKNYTQFKMDVDHVAAGLLSLKYEIGTMIAIQAPNIYEWMVFQFATAKIGWTLVNVNPSFQPPETEFVLNLARCKALIITDEHTMSDYYSMLQELIPDLDKSPVGEIKSERLPHLKTVINIGQTRKKGCLLYSDLIAAGSSTLSQLSDEINSKLDPDSYVNVQFTSGTTGRPKAVPLSHHNILNNANTLGFWSGVAQDENAAICLNVPLMHCFGCVIGSLLSVVHGAKIVMPASRFNGKAALEAIHSHKCTFVYGTPTMYVDMLNQVRPEHNLSSLHSGIMSGSPCPPALKLKVTEQLGIQNLHVAYGSTENSPVVSFTRSDSLSKRPDTVGTAMDHIELKVVDKDGCIVPFGERGEILTRGYQLFRGYLHQPDETQEIIKNGWYHTGDEAVMYEDGLIAITGRTKDMIIRGGENIYPAEIENFLLGMPEIVEANVIGVPDERMGEEVCVWIKIAKNCTLTEDQVRKFCKGKISHFKIPRYIEFVDSFPKTLSGKIQKFQMRKIMNDKLGIEA